MLGVSSDWNLSRIRVRLWPLWKEHNWKITYIFMTKNTEKHQSKSLPLHPKTPFYVCLRRVECSAPFLTQLSPVAASIKVSTSVKPGTCADFWSDNAVFAAIIQIHSVSSVCIFVERPPTLGSTLYTQQHDYTIHYDNRTPGKRTLETGHYKGHLTNYITFQDTRTPETRT